MKNLKGFYPFIAVLLLLSCSQKSTKQESGEPLRIADSISQVNAAILKAEQMRKDSLTQDSIMRAQTLQADRKKSLKVEAFLKDFYNNYLFGNKDFYTITNHFSKSVLKHFEEFYEYECDEPPCYGFYCMRGGSCDPTGKMLSCQPQDNDWFKVIFIEDNIKFSIQIQAKIINGIVVVTDFKAPKVIDSSRARY